MMTEKQEIGFIEIDGERLAVPDDCPAIYKYDRDYYLGRELEHHISIVSNQTPENILLIGSASQCYWQDKARSLSEQALPYVDWQVLDNKNKFDKLVKLADVYQSYAEAWRKWRKKG